MMIQRRLTALAGAALLSVAPAAAAHFQPAAPAVQETANEGAVYMTTTGSTVVRNFQDLNGAMLATLPEGTLVRAFRTSEGQPTFREVEVAGGFPVWVYGEFLQPTDAEGVLLVTGNRVNMRPFPETSPNSMALRTKLSAGQRVKMLERKGSSASFREDWIRVQSPSSAKAWVAASSLQPYTGADARAAWAKMTRPLPAAPKARAKAPSAATRRLRPRSGGGPVGTPGEARRGRPGLRRGDRRCAPRPPRRGEGSSSPSRRSPTKAPCTSATYRKAERRLHEAADRMEFTALREDLNAATEANDAEIRRIDEFLDERQRRKTARWGRFEARGAVESRKVGGVERWYMTFGGETVAEVRCLSGRYDLEIFERFEIGVIGRELQPVVRATATTMAEGRRRHLAGVVSGTTRR